MSSKVSLGCKIVAFSLVVCIFTGLIPSGFTYRVFAKDKAQTFYSPETVEAVSESDDISADIKFDEYETLLEEKLGETAVTENIEPYRRNDVSYQIMSFNDAYTRDYALNSGNFSRILFASPVNYKTQNGEWRKINLNLSLSDGLYSVSDAPYVLSFCEKYSYGKSLLNISHEEISLQVLNLRGIITSRVIHTIQTD